MWAAHALLLGSALAAAYLLLAVHRLESRLDALTATRPRVKRDDSNDVTEPAVEFYHPMMHQFVEEKGRQDVDKGSQWVWLNSYSRVPLNAIQGFCSSTRDYCPPGAPGPAGEAGSPGPRGAEGSKGDRGDRGFPGELGPRGPPGLPGDIGPRGVKGDTGHTGLPGLPGLDGRDGVPGEPGLDGMPGRNGLDGVPGIPGRDGTPGRRGNDGTPGTNGTDGMKGAMGPMGLRGPKGEKGLPGPRGKPGIRGTDGQPGHPAICAYNASTNGTRASALLIPPSIVGAGEQWRKAIVVHEGENVRFRCGASGNPTPHVEWRKADGSVIPMGSWQALSVPGHSLNITHISRRHMGAYTCIADNGIPPQANHTFLVEVYFPPLIRIHNQQVGAANGSSATLECEVEAFPPPVAYWERHDGSLVLRGRRHNVSEVERGPYKFLMQLVISNISSTDYGTYYCISKNEMGFTKGAFSIYGMDPALMPPPPYKTGSQGVAIYGVEPPKLVELEDLCPPPPPQKCTNCADQKEAVKCYDGGLELFKIARDIHVSAFRNVTCRLPKRTLDCQLYAVGKPVFHRSTNSLYGSWMRDPQPRKEALAEKIFVTNESNPNILYEFGDKISYRKDTPTVLHQLKYPFRGNAHVVYKGYFFYNERDAPRMRRYDTESKETLGLEIPGAVVNGTNYLYTSDNNYMDFSVDDNGLWIVYGLTNNNTIVMKVDANSLEVQCMWNISLNHHNVGEMFIVCGVLYAVNSVTERNTKILLAWDLYRNKLLLDVNLAFTNPFSKTTMIGYNHRNKELYTWDKGNQLTYPVRYHEMDHSNVTHSVEPEASAMVQTGYDVEKP